MKSKPKYDLLFDEKFLREKVQKIKIQEQDVLNIKKWISEVDAGTINKEKEGYLKFFELILQQILGYNTSFITHERKARNTNKPVEFSITEENKPEEVKAVIELKGVKHDLWGNTESGKTPIEQALLYGLNNKADLCLVSNYEDFYFFDPKKGTNEAFYLNIREFLDKDNFKLKVFKYLLSKETFFQKQSFSKVSKEFVEVQKNFSKKFYKLFHETRKLLVYELENSNDISRVKAVQYSQKILDRIIFICFAEDRTPLILNRNFLANRLLIAIENKHNLWEELNKIFTDLNKGAGDLLSTSGLEIPKINGGLFKENLFQKLSIHEKRADFPKECFEDHKFKLDKYESELKDYSSIFRNIFLISSFDFESDINVNILGHIFENSLNDIEDLKNQEISQRKKDGIFYTPEYITDYICRNTIIPYLSEKGHNSVEELVKEYSSNSNTITELENKLSKIKIVDPACGSGAFLNKAVDVLFEIHKALDDLKTEKGWYDSKSRSSRKMGISLDKFSAEERIRSIILDNIYGVDLNPESIEITKLSLFLKVASKDHPLPSIDNNIKCGNSLISGISKTEKPLNLVENLDKLIKLKQVDKEMYESQKKVINFEYNQSLEKYFGENWKEQNPFNWEIEFAEIFKEGGFDIVIGNPPYVRQEVFKNLKPCLEKNFEIYNGVADLYTYFFELGIKNLKQKGKFAFIVSDKFVKANYGKSLRNFILINSKFLQYIDEFIENQVFDGATVDPCIIVLEKSNTIDVNSNLLYNYKNLISQKSLDSGSWSFGDEKKLGILSKIKNFKSLKEVIGNVRTGIKTGFNEALIHKEIDIKTIAKTKSEEEVFVKFVKGTDIKKNNLNFSKNYLIYLEDKYLEDFPNINNYLLNYKEKLENRSDIKGKNILWYRLRECAFYEDFKKPKIIFPDISNGMNFTFDDTGMYLDMTCLFVNTENKYFLTLLNSKVLEFYFRSIGSVLGEKGYRLKKQYVETFPIKEISSNEQKPFIEKADLMLNFNKQFQEKLNRFQQDIKDKYSLEKLNNKLDNFYELTFEEFLKEIQKITKLKISSAIEKRNFEDYWKELFETEKESTLKLKQQIDQTDNEINEMVYKLYDLTEDEIKIIEEDLK